MSDTDTISNKMLDIYQKKVKEFFNDNVSPGVIDENERLILDHLSESLEISREDAIRIEAAESKKVKQRHCDIFNFELIEGIKINNKTYVANLKKDLERYGAVSKIDSIQIEQIFNEGKTGALVFEIKAENENESFHKILKYDLFPRIYKEYIILKLSERIQGSLVTSKCEFSSGESGNNYGILVLQPAQFQLGTIHEMSLKEAISRKYILDFSENIRKRQMLKDPLGDVINWLFNSLYQVDTKDGDLLGNHFEIFLPPRAKYESEICTSEDDLKTKGSTTDIFILEKKYVLNHHAESQSGDDVKVSFKCLAPVYKNSEGKSKLSRVDGIAKVDVKKLLYTPYLGLALNRKKITEFPRNSYFAILKKKVSFLDPHIDDFKLSNIFEERKKLHFLDSGYKIETILETTNTKIYFSKGLHGDLNPSNILLCQPGNRLDRLNPFLIDFYESGLSGNMFSDIARLECEITLTLLHEAIREKFPITENHDSLSEEVIQFILNLEERLFFQNRKSESVIGEFILFDLREITGKTLTNLNNPNINVTKDWYKNYIVANAIFALGFSKFKNEPELKRLISIIWSMRLFYRFEHFSKFELDFIPERLSGNNTERMNAIKTPIEELKEICQDRNNKIRDEIGIEGVDQKLYVNFFPETLLELSEFIKFKKENIFILTGESGTGKSTFLDLFTSHNSDLFPILYISGNANIENENSFEEQIQNRLGKEYQIDDWIDKIEDMLDDADKNLVFCVIIENIYLNSNQDLSVKSLLKLLSSVAGKRIKIILSATQEFFNEHLDQESLISANANKVQITSKGLVDQVYYIKLEKPDEVLGEELLKKYLSFYRINGEPINKARSIYLNPGILKMFCEIKQNQNIGKPEHIFLTDLIVSFVKDKHNKLQKHSNLSNEKIELFMNQTADFVDRNNIHFIPNANIEKIYERTISSENYPFKNFKNLASQIGYISILKNSIKFRFPEIAAYLKAKTVVDGWTSKSFPMEEILAWFKDRIKEMRKKPINEIILYYALTLIYSRRDQQSIEIFNNSLKFLIDPDVFKTSAYGLFRVFSRSVSTLPGVNAETLDTIMQLENQAKDFMRNTKDRVFSREYQDCFRRLDEILEISKEARFWTVNFEKALKLNNPIKIVKLFKHDEFRWEEFSSFLKKDFQKSSNFIHNYLEPVLKVIIDNPTAIHGHELSTIRLSNLLLNINKNSKFKFGKFEEPVYEILFNIAEIHKDSHNTTYAIKAIEEIIRRKVYDKDLFQRVARKVREFSKQYEKDGLWLQFLLNYNDFDNSIDISFGYDQLDVSLGKISYENLDHGIRQELDTYLYNAPKEYARPLVKKLNLKSPLDIAKFKRITVVKEEQTDTTTVINFIIKQGDTIYLKYNSKWNDFNWISEQTPHMLEKKYRDIEASIAAQSIIKKLKIAPSNFQLSRFSQIPSVEKYSKNKKKLIKYNYIFYFLKILDPIYWNTIKRQLQAFSIERILEEVNVDISSAVKTLIAHIDNSPELRKAFDNKPNVIDDEVQLK